MTPPDQSQGGHGRLDQEGRFYAHPGHFNAVPHPPQFESPFLHVGFHVPAELGVLATNGLHQRQLIDGLSTVHTCTAKHAPAATVNTSSLPQRCNDDNVGVPDPIAVEAGQLLNTKRLEHRLVAVHQFMADVCILVGTEYVHFSLGNALCLSGAIN